MNNLTNTKTPQELLEWMKNNLTYYGVVKKHLYTPKDVIKTKQAHCWESVELTRVELINMGFNCHIVFFRTQDDSVTHTACLYEDNKKYYWLEWAWGKYEGIHGSYNTFDKWMLEITSKLEKEYNAKVFAYYGNIYIHENMTQVEYFNKAVNCKEYKLNTDKQPAFLSW
jgi:hypothetical protein